MTAHSVLNVRAAPEWGNSELYKYYERNGLGYGTVHSSAHIGPPCSIRHCEVPVGLNFQKQQPLLKAAFVAATWFCST